jgi:glycerophosphoryl diester phosphodiesterase
LENKNHRLLDNSEILIIAHRGESYDAPENTIGAVDLAWERGALAVEVDVHLTADNQICIIHDHDTFRTTGKRMLVKQASMADLHKQDAGSWKNPAWANERIPSLPEVLASVPSHGKIIIEIKSRNLSADKLEKDILDSKLNHEQIEIISFNLNTLIQLKKVLSQYKMLWLVESRPRFCAFLNGTNPSSLIKKARKYKLDGINIGDSRYLTERVITRLKSGGLQVYTWTINDPERAKQLETWELTQLLPTGRHG